MSEFNEIGNLVLQEFISRAEKQGLVVSGTDPETGQLRLQSLGGRTALINLLNLVEYCYRSRDENAVRDFVINIAATLNSQETPAWEKAKNEIYLSLCSTEAEVVPPFAKEVTEFCYRHFILDSPASANWVTPDMLGEWGITEEEMEKQALANGDALLGATNLKIDDIQGHSLGSFVLRDNTLNAALLLAPGLKNKVQKEFGWPLFAVIPSKTTCYFFGRSDCEFFEKRLATVVVDVCKSPRCVTPELLEFSDAGISSLCFWMRKKGYILKF